MITNPLQRAIQDIRYAGETPLLQYDILDSTTLLRHVGPYFSRLNSRRVAIALRLLEMYPIGLHSIAGQPCMLWTCLPHQPVSAIVAAARLRVQTRAIHLQAERVSDPKPLPVPPSPAKCFTPFDWSVLTIRLGRQGMRYPRPREIAKRLNSTADEVNRSLQTIRRMLGLRSLKDAGTFRRVVRDSGILLKDPAFQ